jgi:hypothetical protein
MYENITMKPTMCAVIYMDTNDWICIFHMTSVLHLLTFSMMKNSSKWLAIKNISKRKKKVFILFIKKQDHLLTVVEKRNCFSQLRPQIEHFENRKIKRCWLDWFFVFRSVVSFAVQKSFILMHSGCLFFFYCLCCGVISKKKKKKSLPSPMLWGFPPLF